MLKEARKEECKRDPHKSDHKSTDRSDKNGNTNSMERKGSHFIGGLGFHQTEEALGRQLMEEGAESGEKEDDQGESEPEDLPEEVIAMRANMCEGYRGEK